MVARRRTKVRPACARRLRLGADLDFGTLGPIERSPRPRRPAAQALFRSVGLRLWSIVNEVQDLLQVLPGLSLGCLVITAQQERRVIADHHWDIAPPIPIAAHTRHAFLTAGEIFRRGSAQRADSFGANSQ